MASSELNPQQAQLTLEKAKAIHFYSFYISQGNPDLQEKLFKYLHIIRPNWRMNYELGQQVIAGNDRRIDKVTHPNDYNIAPLHKNLGKRRGRLPGSSMPSQFDQVKDATWQMGKYFAESKKHNFPYTRESMAEEITKDLLDKDFDYMEDGRPRSTDKIPNPYNPMTDPRLSFLAFYVLGRDQEGRRNSLGIEEFDQLFDDVEKIILSLSIIHLHESDDPFDRKSILARSFAYHLPRILAIFNNTHHMYPYMKVSVPKNIGLMHFVMKALRMEEPIAGTKFVLS